MKIAFYSNFLTHHQIPFCLDMISNKDIKFTFVSTIKITEERLKLGYENLDNDYNFVLKAYENQINFEKSLKLAMESDVVIIGTTDDIYIKERLKADKLIFRYRERIFRRWYKNII